MASKTRGHIKGLMHRIFDCAMLWEYLPPDRNPMSLVRIEGSSKRRRKPRILTPEEFAILIASVDREPCHTMVILALCTGVRCSELVALKWSDFDWENLSVYIRRAIVSGRVDDVKTEYSEAPLPLDPALAEVIFEWRRKTEFSADSDFVFASPFMAGEKPYTPWNMQHNHLSPAAVKAGLRTDRLAHASPYLPGVVGRQWRTAYGAEGAHAARIHPDHAEYLWRRDDGLNAGSAWAGGEAGDGALMDVSGRQPIA